MCARSSELQDGVHSEALDHSGWLLDALRLGPGSRYRTFGSLLLGIGGTVAFAVASCLLTGAAAVLISFEPGPIRGPLFTFVIFLSAYGSYFATQLAVQLLATCELPISIRLSLIYATVFLCWNAAIWMAGENITTFEVIATIPFCFGALAMHRFRGWRTTGSAQSVKNSPMSIASLLDATTAVAITLGLFTLSGREVQWMDLAASLACSSVFMVAFGMHVWARLLWLCPNPNRAGTGFGIWMAINTMLAFLAFVSFAVAYATSPIGLIGFLAAPCSLLVAHLWTEAPLRWLRGCGWTMIRGEEEPAGEQMNSVQSEPT